MSWRVFCCTTARSVCLSLSSLSAIPRVLDFWKCCIDSAVPGHLIFGSFEVPHLWIEPKLNVIKQKDSSESEKKGNFTSQLTNNCVQVAALLILTAQDLQVAVCLLIQNSCSKYVWKIRVFIKATKVPGFVFYQLSFQKASGSLISFFFFFFSLQYFLCLHDLVNAKV